MSKNFETEYKKYADNTVPDLWSRIEAGVDAYEESIRETEAGSEEKITGKIVNIEDYNKNKVTDIQEDKTNKTRKKINIKPYIGAIAACACMFLVVIAIKSISSSSQSAATAESAAPAAAPMAEAATDSDTDYAPAAEEAYAESVEESIDAYKDDMADEAAVYEAEAPDAAEEAAPMEESEEAAPEDNVDLNTYASGNSKMSLTNDAASESFKTETQETSSVKDKKSLEVRGTGKEITVFALPDIASLNDDDGTIDLKITDPLDTDLKKDEVIKVDILKDEKGKYINGGVDINTINGSESRMFKVVLEVSDTGKYTLKSIE